MLRTVSVVIPLLFVLTACGPTVYRPSPFERLAIEVPQTLTAEFFASHPSVD